MRPHTCMYAIYMAIHMSVSWGNNNNTLTEPWLDVTISCKSGVVEKNWSCLRANMVARP